MPLFNNNQPMTSEKTPSPVELKTPQATATQNKSVTNKVTINSLLTGVHTTPNTIAEVSSKKNTDTTSSQVQEMRFVSVKYKIYTLAIVTFLIIIYGPVSDAVHNSFAKRDQWSAIDTTINERIDKQAEYKDKTELLQSIETNKTKIVSCVNENVWCEQLPENISSHLDVVKSYIQIGDLTKDKMEVNESKILKTINEFMTKANILSIERKYNGTVTNINIWSTQPLENNIIKVPVSMTVTFDTKENLINFISNIESNVFYSQTDGLNDSILYRIDELRYDIVNYKETQDVSVTLSAYAYNE